MQSAPAQSSTALKQPTRSAAFDKRRNTSIVQVKPQGARNRGNPWGTFFRSGAKVVLQIYIYLQRFYLRVQNNAALSGRLITATQGKAVTSWARLAGDWLPILRGVSRLPGWPAVAVGVVIGNGPPIFSGLAIPLGPPLGGAGMAESPGKPGAPAFDVGVLCGYVFVANREDIYSSQVPRLAVAHLAVHPSNYGPTTASKAGMLFSAKAPNPHLLL